MDDDLNISAAMASIFKNIKRINTLILEDSIDGEDAQKIIDAFRNIDTVLKIFDFGDELSNPEIEHLIKEREDARRVKNWALADKIRDQLINSGISVRDRRL
jgi:cysteinyl-tRNA synthetase